MTHIMRINEQEFLEKLNIKPMSKDRINSGNVPSQYNVMCWFYPEDDGIKRNYQNIDDETMRLVTKGGDNITLSELIDDLLTFSTKTGISLKIKTPIGKNDTSCVVYADDVFLGSFIITSIKDNPKILRMAVGSENKDIIQID